MRSFGRQEDTDFGSSRSRRADRRGSERVL